jgi:hypothetical protein
MKKQDLNLFRDPWVIQVISAAISGCLKIFDNYAIKLINAFFSILNLEYNFLKHKKTGTMSGFPVKSERLPPSSEYASKPAVEAL